MENEKKLCELFNEFLKEHYLDYDVIETIRRRFNRIGKKSTIRLINLIKNNQEIIYIFDFSDKWRELYRTNKPKFHMNFYLLPNIISSLRYEILGILYFKFVKRYGKKR